MSNNSETTQKCMKCRKTVMSAQTRTYHLALKNNINQNSWLAKADKIILCVSCDNSRKTNLAEYLS